MINLDPQRKTTERIFHWYRFHPYRIKLTQEPRQPDIAGILSVGPGKTTNCRHNCHSWFLKILIEFEQSIKTVRVSNVNGFIIGPYFFHADLSPKATIFFNKCFSECSNWSRWMYKRTCVITIWWNSCILKLCYPRFFN